MPNFTFETDAAKSAAPLNWYVRLLHAMHGRATRAVGGPGDDGW
jgi:hypothetical protein